MRRMRVLPIAVLGVSLMIPASASAATITVDTTVDGTIATTDDGNCGLREAITATNTNADVNGADDCDHDGGTGDDTINFAAVFNGEAADVIALGSDLPVISQKLAINAGDCDPGSAPKPCVEVQGTGTGAVISLSGAPASASSVRGLAVTNGILGVIMGASVSDAVVAGNWIGVKLDGTSDPNATGIQLSPTATGATIGGTAPGDRNVLYANTTNLGMVASDDNVVQGNWFGLLPDGSPGASAPSQDIVIDDSGADRAENNAIGVADGTTPGVCDLGCNVISRAAGDGIDLTPAGSNGTLDTTIEGNFIGLDPAGGLDQGNSDGIDVGNADGTTIGGQAAGASNYIGGNARGIYGFTGATGLAIENNFIGLTASKASVVPDDNSGVELETSAADVVVNQNHFAGDGSKPFHALALGFSSASVDVHGNEFGTSAASQGFGSWMIDVQGDSHEIGGDTAAEANEISNETGEGIRIRNDGSDGNAVLRNLGSGNGDLFLNLTPPNGFGNDSNGPNNGIQAPAVGSARRGKDRVKGTGVPGATVLLYRAEAATGESPAGLLKFLGEKVVGPAGNWKLNPAGKLKKSWRVSANQTSAVDGSSEFALAKKVKR